MPSQDFERFYESCFGDSFGVIHSGVDEKALSKLQDEERKEIEKLLLQALGTSKDTYSRPVIALGLLGSREASETLKQRLHQATGIDRIHTALALFRVEGFPEAKKIIIHELRITDAHQPDEMTRWLAASLLPHLGRTPEIVRALSEAMSDTETMVSNSAITSLRTLFIDDEPIRDLLGQILLNLHDVHKPNFVPRHILVQQAKELISSRLSQ